MNLFYSPQSVAHIAKSAMYAPPTELKRAIIEESLLMTQVALCKLCLLQKELMNSHFLPASIYKLCRDGATGQNPIAVSQGVAKLTTEQISDYVFCSDCERRLNENGEAWVHLNMAQPERFLIRDALETVAPAMARDTLAMYAGGTIPGINMDQLSYFGLSVFWRAAVHRWPSFNPVEPRMETLSFGKYEESIRLFLLNGAPEPANISLLISVWPWKDPQPPFAFNTPVGQKTPDWHSYSFYIPGLAFNLLVGKGISPILRIMSAYTKPERYIYSSEVAAAQMWQSFAKVVGSSEAVGKLARGLQDKR